MTAIQISTEECAICYEPVNTSFINEEDSVTIIKCGHIFHQKCLVMWEQYDRSSQEGFSCPLCRQVYKSKAELGSSIWKIFYSFINCGY